MTQESSLFPDADIDVATETAPASGRFAEIAFDRPLDHAYTYAIPEGLSVDPGQRVSCRLVRAIARPSVSASASARRLLLGP